VNDRRIITRRCDLVCMDGCMVNRWSTWRVQSTETIIGHKGVTGLDSKHDVSVRSFVADSASLQELVSDSHSLSFTCNNSHFRFRTTPYRFPF